MLSSPFFFFQMKQAQVATWFLISARKRYVKVAWENMVKQQFLSFFFFIVIILDVSSVTEIS